MCAPGTGASGNQLKEINKLEPLSYANNAQEAFSICLLGPVH